MTLAEFDTLLEGQRKLSRRERAPKVQTLSVTDWIQRVSAGGG